MFLQDRRSDLRRIAARTQGEMTPEDLSSEAWLLAQEIEAKLNRPFNFADRLDQDRLLAWMNNRFVNFADKSVRHAIKLDTGWDDEAEGGAGARLSRMLLAPDSTDPHKQRMAEEEAGEMLEAVQRSYSQAAAFVILLIRTDWDVRALAADLWMGLGTLRKRMKAAAELALLQPTLFDGVDLIPLNFAPTRKRHAWRRLLGVGIQIQERWWSCLTGKVTA
ncbi:MAG: hypothetical protein ACREO7_03090 [Pseudoxanthomonas sp.]